MIRAALFDLDRTYVRVNTATLYARWLSKRGEARRRDLARFAWWVARYSVGALDASAIARELVKPFKGVDAVEFAARVAAWVGESVIPHVSPRAREVLARYRAEGYRCALLTSSTSFIAEPLARAEGIDDVICSRLESRDGVFTGALIEPFCYGLGKVVTAERWATAEGVDLAQSIFFTDSIADLPMLDRVGTRVVVNPDPRLRFTAWRRGWPVERW